MTWHICIAYLCGSATTFIVMSSVIKHLRKANAKLMAESDYYFMIGKLFYNAMSSEQQKEVDEGIELRMIRDDHHRNINKIKHTGKY